MIEDDLNVFSNVHTLDISENRLPFARIGKLESLKKLNFSCNGLTSLDLEVDGRFKNLESLDLSFNSVDHAAQIVLATLPKLKHLDLTYNKIKTIAPGIHDMTNWKYQVIELIMPAEVAALGLDSANKPITDMKIENNICSSLLHPSIGFQALESLILESNPLDSSSWAILSQLPK